MTDPEWLPRTQRRAMPPEALMALAVDVALASARNGGGPFGAVIADANGQPVALGWNQVLATHDSTAHAEIVAMRRAEQQLATHRLEGLALFTSCAPCIQCFGAIYWSGIARVYAAARKADAETIGFDEGPPMEALWEHARAARGIAYVPDFQRDERALAPLRVYRERGGVDYSHR